MTEAQDDDPVRSSTTMLLERARDRDAAALDELVKRLQPKIERWIRRERGDAIRQRFETMDLSQDVAMELIQFIPRLAVRNARVLDRVLYRMIRNTICDTSDRLSALRRRLTRERPLPSDTMLALDPPARKVPSPPQIADQNEQEAWKRVALALLPPADQELLLRRIEYREPWIDIGRSHDISADAARKKFSRVMARLVSIVSQLKRGGLERVLAEIEKKEGEDGESV